MFVNVFYVYFKYKIVFFLWFCLKIILELFFFIFFFMSISNGLDFILLYFYLKGGGGSVFCIEMKMLFIII